MRLASSFPRGKPASCWALLGLLTAGCGEASSGAGASAETPALPTLARAHAQVGGEVVSTVDGEPITLSEVREAATRLHVAPLDALRRIQSELAIVHRAEATSLVQDAEVERAAQRAAVRGLLRTQIEAAHTAEGQTSAAVEARYAEIAQNLVSPEQRVSTHLLVPIAADADQARRDAARRIAEGMLRDVALATDEAAALTQMDALAGTHGAFEVSVEHLPAFAQGDIETSFADALFGMTEPGLVPSVVETSYGFHVIYLQRIEAPWTVPREEWEPALRRQLSVEARAQALIALTDDLGERQRVLMSPHLDAIMANWPTSETSITPPASITPHASITPQELP